MRLLFFCLFACFLFNCGHPTVPRNIDVTRISKSDLQKVRSFDPTQLIDSCTYIPLETSDRILIGRVKQLKITDKYIFLVNSENDSLYVHCGTDSACPRSSCTSLGFAPPESRLLV